MKRNKKSCGAAISSFAKRHLPSLLTEKDLGHIIVNKDSFEAELNGQRRNIALDKICKITAFKMDLLTSDLICLEIESEDGTSFLVNEDMKGFSDLCKVLNKILPNIREDWYQAVVLPPFEPNVSVIWQR